MKKENVEAWEQIRGVDDDEIRNFFMSEKDRLGDILDGFKVSWARTETDYRLELWSQGHQLPGENQQPLYGSGFELGRIPIMIQNCDTLQQVQQAGRAVYFLWKKEIKNLKRDLSVK